jgi:hypothetical protein
VREAAAKAWPMLDSLYGPLAQQLQRFRYVVRPVDPDSARRSDEDWGVGIPTDFSVTALTEWLLASTPIGEADAPLRHWLGGGIRPSLRVREEASAAYVSLVTAHFEVARACFQGDIASCRSALDLDEGPSAIERLYRDPAERRYAVSQAESYFRDATHQASLYACGSGDDSACVELLASLPAQARPRPLNVTARQLLVRVTLRIGGREAYQRLMSRPDQPIAARLVASAGIPVDSLVSRWRVELLEARPEPVTLPLVGPLVGLGWAVVFGLCGLRSSRWRAA